MYFFPDIIFCLVIAESVVVYSPFVVQNAILANIAETEKQTEMAARVSSWKQKIEHNLQEQVIPSLLLRFSNPNFNFDQL